jgi:RNA polymerase sigma factor (sigma-70 family)
MKAATQTGNRYYQLSDEKLISLIATGQQQAYSTLVNRHERLLRFVLRRYLTDPETVKEVIQDTFMRAFRALPGFRGDSKFSTWLSKIAVSLAINRLRVKRYSPWASLDDTLQHWEKDLHDHEVLLEKQESSQLLRQALLQLSPQDATALDLFYFREQSIEEIGRLTGWTTTNVKSRLSRARQRLHKVLVNEGLHTEYYS